MLDGPADPTKDPRDERFYLVSEVAETIRVTPETVTSWIRTGRLDATNVGTKAKPNYRITENEFRRLLAGELA